VHNPGLRPSLALGAALVAAALPDRALAQAGRIGYETFTLPNGLRVIYSEAHATPIVTVDVWYNTGSRNERPGHSGFAHLFEHMMFQGSAHVKKAEHFQLIQRAGVEMNGSTTEDRPISGGPPLQPTQPRSLARSRPIAPCHHRFELSQPARGGERRAAPAGTTNRTPGVHDGLTAPFDSVGCFAYAHTVIGSMADLDGAKLGDVQAFFETYYARTTPRWSWSAISIRPSCGAGETRTLRASRATPRRRR